MQAGWQVPGRHGGRKAGRYVFQQAKAGSSNQIWVAGVVRAGRQTWEPCKENVHGGGRTQAGMGHGAQLGKAGKVSFSPCRPSRQAGGSKGVTCHSCCNGAWWNGRQAGRQAVNKGGWGGRHRKAGAQHRRQGQAQGSPRAGNGAVVGQVIMGGGRTQAEGVQAGMGIVSVCGQGTRWGE